MKSHELYDNINEYFFFFIIIINFYSFIIQKILSTEHDKYILSIMVWNFKNEKSPDGTGLKLFYDC